MATLRLPVVLIKLLDPALIHLSDGAMVAGEDHDDNTFGGIVLQRMDFSIDAWQGKVRGG
jgi:hypothetical protein